MNYPHITKDSKGNIIHQKNFNGYEWWREYDSNGKVIHYKDSDGFESWWEYDSNNNEIHYKKSDGFEWWSEYDSNNNEIHYKKSDGYEEWKEYDSNGKVIHYKNSNGEERWYDSEGNSIPNPNAIKELTLDDIAKKFGTLKESKNKEAMKREIKRYTVQEIAEYIAGWASGPFGSVEEIGKAVLLNALSQLQDDQDGIEAVTAARRKVRYSCREHQN